jgi:hypothetical protein
VKNWEIIHREGYRELEYLKEIDGLIHTHRGADAIQGWVPRAVQNSMYTHRCNHTGRLKTAYRVIKYRAGIALKRHGRSFSVIRMGNVIFSGFSRFRACERKNPFHN